MARATVRGSPLSMLLRLKSHGFPELKDHQVHLGVSSLVQSIEKEYAMLGCRCCCGSSEPQSLVLVLE